MGPERLEAACARAVAAGAYRYKSVASILKAGLDRQPVTPEPADTVPRTHEHVRGADYYH